MYRKATNIFSLLIDDSFIIIKSNCDEVSFEKSLPKSKLSGIILISIPVSYPIESRSCLTSIILLLIIYSNTSKISLNAFGLLR